MLLKGSLHDLINAGRGYGHYGYGSGYGYGHYGCGHSGSGFGCYNVNIENHEDAEYVIEG